MWVIYNVVIELHSEGLAVSLSRYMSFEFG